MLHLIVILVILIVLFPGIRRRFTRVMWIAFGALVLFLLVVSLSQS